MNSARLELTDRIILADIAIFKARIAAARAKLEKLNEQMPSGWKEKKKLKAKKRDLDGEITHVNSLIGIARTALDTSESQP